METFSAAGRSANLTRMAQEPFDVLVIGGGITGAGVALDAATRGYSVALVERNDFASGTSSKSTKLAHGGSRYQPQFDIALVHESLIERGWMLQNVLRFGSLAICQARIGCFGGALRPRHNVPRGP